MKVLTPMMRVALLLLLNAAGHAFAENGKDSITPDFFLETQYAFTTSKSKLVSSNDTGSALRYGFGTYSGGSAKLGFMLHFDHDDTNFALNGSKVDMSWQDTRVRYHLGFFYLGVLFTRLEMAANREGESIINAAGAGVGVNTGLLYGLGRGGSLYLDIQSASIANMKNTEDQSLSIKQRLDIDLGGSMDLTAKLLDFTFGYRIRQLTIETDSSYKEALYSTYLGFRFAFFF